MPGMPPRVKTLIKTFGHYSALSNMASVRNNIRSCNNITRHAAAKQIDELSMAEARAVGKVLELPRG